MLEFVLSRLAIAGGSIGGLYLLKKLGVNVQDLINKKALTEEDRIKLSNEYTKLMAFNEKIGGMALLDTYNKNRETNAELLKKQWANSPNLDDVFRPTEETKKAETEFKAVMEQLDADIAEGAGTYPLFAVVDVARENATMMIDAIKKQQEEEIKRLESAFGDPADDSQSAAHQENKKKALGELKKHHQQQLKSFQDGLNKRLDKMERQAKQQEDSAFYTLYMANASKKWRDEIERQHLQNKANKNNSQGASVTVSQDGSDLRAQLSGFDIKQMKVIESITGLKITRDGNRLHVTFPGLLGSLWERLRHPQRTLSYAGAKVELANNLLCLAGAMRASGEESIEMSLSHNDPDTAALMGREGYAACIRAGFDPNKITIKVNNEKKTVAELFKGKESELDLLNDERSKIEARRNEYRQHATAVYKNSLAARREANAQTSNADANGLQPLPDTPAAADTPTLLGNR